MNVRCIDGPEQKVGAEGDSFLPAEIHCPGDGRFRRGKLPGLVEFAVIREIGLDGCAKDAAPMEDDSAIEQAAVHPQGHPDHENRAQRRRLIKDSLEGRHGTYEECVLVEEVLVGVGRQTQLRKYGQDGLSLMGLAGHFDGFLRIEGWIGDLNLRNADRRANKAMPVQVEERIWGLHVFLPISAWIAFPQPSFSRYA